MVSAFFFWVADFLLFPGGATGAGATGVGVSKLLPAAGCFLLGAALEGCGTATGLFVMEGFLCPAGLADTTDAACILVNL